MTDANRRSAIPESRFRPQKARGNPRASMKTMQV
jgi:hypothetical protein